MRIKEEEEKEGRVCCNKLEFLLLHNKQTNEGFHRLISLSLSLSVVHSLITCCTFSFSLLPVVACENYTALVYFYESPFLDSFFYFSLFWRLFSSFFPHARQPQLNMPTEKKKKASAASKKKKTATKEEEREEEEQEEEEQQQPPKTPMAPPQKLPQITVARLLNETQLGVSMHKRIIQQMTTLRANNPQMFLQEMCKCLLHVLLEYKVRRRHRASLFRVFVVFIHRRRRRRRVSTNDFKILDMNSPSF